MSALGDLLEWYGVKFCVRKQIIIKGSFGLSSLVLCWHDTAVLKGAAACVLKRNQCLFSLPRLWTDMRGSCVKEGWAVDEVAPVILMLTSSLRDWKSWMKGNSSGVRQQAQGAELQNCLWQSQLVWRAAEDRNCCAFACLYIWGSRKTLSVLPTVTFYSAAAEHHFFCFHLNHIQMATEVASGFALHHNSDLQMCIC